VTIRERSLNPARRPGGDDKDDDQEPNEAPETPPGEPPPEPVRDPPPDEAPSISYVVSRVIGQGPRRKAVNESGRKERRGFASMSPEKQREIASKGGRAAHQKGTAHEWTSDEARTAGRKGGQVSRGGRGRLPESMAADVVGAESMAGEGK
jgi:uncharacterized protein